MAAAPGLENMDRLRSAGYSDAEIAAWREDRVRKLSEGGFTNTEIQAYFGNGPLDFRDGANGVRSRVDGYNATLSGGEGGARMARDFFDALEAGWQVSISGLGSRERLPDMVLPSDAPIWHHMASGIATAVGDMPVSVPSFIGGFKLGAAPGAAVGGAAGAPFAGVGAGPGAVIGGVIGGSATGGAAAGAATDGLRAGLLDFYEKNPNASARDYMTGLATSFWNKEVFDAASEGSTIGAAAGLAGGFTRGAFMIRNPASRVGREVAVGSAEFAATVAAVSAIEKELPSKEMIAVAAAVTTGITAGSAFTVRMRQGKRGADRDYQDAYDRTADHWAQTGEHPYRTAQRAEADPIFRQTVGAGDDYVNRFSRTEPVDVDPSSIRMVVDEDVTPIPQERAIVPYEQLPPNKQEAYDATENLHEKIVTAGWRENGPPSAFAWDAPDTRGQGRFFHGTSSAITALGDRFSSSSMNYYGAGFYSTDALDIARGYTRKGRGSDPSLYEVEEVNTVKFYDMEQPIAPEVENYVKYLADDDGVASEIILNALEEQPKNLRELFDAIRDVSAYEMSASSVRDLVFDPITDHLVELGFGGMTHTGGLRTKKRPHQVKIYFHPEVDLRITKTGGPAEPPPRRPPPPPPPARQEVAPPSGGAGQPPVPPRGPGIFGADDGPPRLPPPDGSGDLGDAMNSVLGQIHPLPKWRYDIDDFRYDFVNDLQYIVSQAEDSFRAATGKRLTVHENPGELARLAFGAPAIADLELARGVFDRQTGKRLGPGLKQIVEQIPSKDRDFFKAYMVSLRVLEKEGQGFETGFNPNDASIIANAGNRNKKFVKAQKEIQEWLTRTRLVPFVQSGLMSLEQAQAHVRANADFVPFIRLGDWAVGSPGSTGRGLGVRRPTKKFEGSERDILNPFEVLVRNEYAAKQVIANNEARQRIVDFNERLPKEFRFIDPVSPSKKNNLPSSSRDLILRDQNAVGFMEENGLDPDDLGGLGAWHAAQRQLGDKQFAVFYNGQPRYFAARDPRLIKSLSSMDGASFNILLRMARVPASLFRTGTVITPDFVLRSIARDNLGTFIFNSFKVVPIWDTLTGMGSLFADEKGYAKWIMNGGAHSALLDSDRHILNRGFGDPATLNALGLDKAWNVATSPITWLYHFAQYAENAPRISVFKRGEKLYGLEGAALNSRDIIDFARMGSKMRALNSVTPFYGAYVNGVDRFYQAFKDDFLGTWMKAVAGVTIPAVLLWLWHRDAQWWKDREDWEKANYFMFPVGGTYDNPDSIIRIPMPHEFGVVFGYIPVRTLEQYVNDVPGALDDIREEVLNEFIQFPVPMGISPLMEIGFNHSMFTNRPLVSYNAERNLLPQYRYTAYTSESAKKISGYLQALGANRFTTPVAVEHLIRNWTGALGVAMFQAVDLGMRKSGVLDDPVRAGSTLSDIPFVRGFFARNPSASRALDDFYSAATQTRQIRGSIDEMVMQGKTAEANRLLRHYQTMLTDLGGAEQALSSMQQLVHGVNYMDEMTPDEKRQIIDEVTRQMVLIADSYTETFRRISETEPQGAAR